MSDQKKGLNGVFYAYQIQIFLGKGRCPLVTPSEWLTVFFLNNFGWVLSNIWAKKEIKLRILCPSNMKFSYNPSEYLAEVFGLLT